MSVVCNSSVLIALSVINQLRLLQKRFEGKKVLIPRARRLQEQLDALQDEGRFRISPELHRRALREVGEKEKDE